MADGRSSSGSVAVAGGAFDPVLRSPLADVFDRPDADAVCERAGVHAAEWGNIACLVVRGHIDDTAFMAGVSESLGVTLPTRPSSFAATDGVVVLWMSPDEWWVLLPRAGRDVVMRRLQTALQNRFVQLVDTSGSLTCLRLAGPEHLTVLRHLTPYDVQRIPVGGCVSTVVQRAQLTLVRPDEAGIMLVFRRSFADWTWRLIERASRPYGLARCTPAQLSARHFSNLLESRV